MGDELIEVPLFPLSVVLFPGMALPLHIFEPRYRAMMRDCLDSQLPIGVVLAPSESMQLCEMPAKVGTFARIADYERLPDGKYNLLAVGTHRFEIVELHREPGPYLRSLVRVLDEAEIADDDDALAALAAQARASLEAYLTLVMALVGSDDCAIQIPDDPHDLSYLIAMCLGCDDAEKQHILEMPSVTQRLETGLLLLTDEMTAIQDQQESTVSVPSDTDRSFLN